MSSRELGGESPKNDFLKGAAYLAGAVVLDAAGVEYISPTNELFGIACMAFGTTYGLLGIAQCGLGVWTVCSNRRTRARLAALEERRREIGVTTIEEQSKIMIEELEGFLRDAGDNPKE